MRRLLAPSIRCWQCWEGGRGVQRLPASFNQMAAVLGGRQGDAAAAGSPTQCCSPNYSDRGMQQLAGGQQGGQLHGNSFFLSSHRHVGMDQVKMAWRS